MTALNKAFIKVFSKDQNQSAPPQTPMAHRGTEPVITEPSQAIGQRTTPEEIPVGSHEIKEPAQSQLSKEMIAHIVHQDNPAEASKSTIPSPHFELKPLGPPKSVSGRENLLGAEKVVDQQFTPQTSPSVSYEPEQQCLRPALQVDQFIWPKICDQIIAKAAGGFDQLTAQLIVGLTRGRKTLALSSCNSGEGSTTTLLCIAKRLSALGIKVALVDAQFANARLAKQLGLSPPAGWDQVLRGEIPLTEALVESIQDNLTLLPLAETTLEGIGAFDIRHVSTTIEALRNDFDLVLLDCGALLEAPQANIISRGQNAELDSVILVRDIRCATDVQMIQATRLVAAAGMTICGVAENFVQADSARKAA